MISHSSSAMLDVQWKHPGIAVAWIDYTQNYICVFFYIALNFYLKNLYREFTQMEKEFEFDLQGGSPGGYPVVLA